MTLRLDNLMKRKESYVHADKEMFGDRHVTGTLVELPSPAAGVTVEGADKPYSQGQEVALECDAEIQGRGQVDAVPVEDGMLVLFHHEAASNSDQCPQAEDTPPEGVNDVEANCLVRRSLLVPRRFKERLAGPGECFLEYLRGHHSVMVLQDPARDKLHIKGRKKNVLDCYTAVRALLAE